MTSGIEPTNNVRVVAADELDGLAALLSSELVGASGSNSVQLAEMVEELTEWWLSTAADEAQRTVFKAVEYGAHDLVEIGRNLAYSMGRDNIDDATAAEMGVYFYLLGKVARWTSAIRDGRKVSDDTLLDIGIYVRMAQRIRSNGGWPGTQQSKQQ